MTQPTQNDLGNTKPNRRTRSRAYIVVLNNYSAQDLVDFRDFCITKGWKGIIAEECGQNGTPHIQAYVRAANAFTFNTLKKFNNKFHIESARGSLADNFRYCSKEGRIFWTNITIEQTWPHQGPLGYKWPLTPAQVADRLAALREIDRSEGLEKVYEWIFKN